MYIQNNIFKSRCVSCHSGNFASGGLDLSEDFAYENLVNIESNGSTKKRVVPYDSENSYLYLSLEGDEAPQMPPTEKLNIDKINSIVQWIDDGAIE